MLPLNITLQQGVWWLALLGSSFGANGVSFPATRCNAQPAQGAKRWGRWRRSNPAAADADTLYQGCDVWDHVCWDADCLAVRMA
jgi:hypothetical protein